MLNLVENFAAGLRAGGLRISTAEVLDCLSQLELIDQLNESQFRSTLRTNFVKSHRDMRRFEHIYRLYFHEQQSDFSALEERSEVQELLERLPSAGAIEGEIRDFLLGEPLGLLERFEQIRISDAEQRSSKLAVSQLGGNLEIMIALNRMRRELGLVLGQADDELGWENSAAVRTYLDERLNSVQSMLLNSDAPLNESLRHVRTNEQHIRAFGEKPFSALSAQELEEMQAAIERLVRKLKDLVARRHQAASRSHLDVKQTLRRAGRYQGIPLELCYRKHAPAKGKVVAICDISSSVWGTARFMLSVLYALQECFSRVNSFVFINRICEVSEVLENHEINRALELVLRELDISYGAPTDYGAALLSFREHHMDVLNKRTTLIIMGDARSNYMNPRSEILGELREKCRRIIWLNPEPEKIWHTGDSEMLRYKPYCHELRTCRNLNQLISFIEDLVL